MCSRDRSAMAMLVLCYIIVWPFSSRIYAGALPRTMRATRPLAARNRPTM